MANPQDVSMENKSGDPSKEVVVFCPACREEQFTVTVTDSGSGPDEWGTCYWFGGDGKCSACGHASYYSDSSH
jgi:hypothetical protein